MDELPIVPMPLYAGAGGAGAVDEAARGAGVAAGQTVHAVGFGFWDPTLAADSASQRPVFSTPTVTTGVVSKVVLVRDGESGGGRAKVKAGNNVGSFLRNVGPSQVSGRFAIKKPDAK